MHGPPNITDKNARRRRKLLIPCATLIFLYKRIPLVCTSKYLIEYVDFYVALVDSP